MHGESQYMEVLSSLYSAINERQDLGEALNLVLEQVSDLLHVDAAAVLLYNSLIQGFSYVARRGFRTNEIDGPDSSLATDLLSRATVESQFVYIPDLREEQASSRTQRFQSEGFVSYYGLPFFSKGQILGGLEVFDRAPLTLDRVAIAFLKALAAEIVLAANKSQLSRQLEQLHLELERSNLELELAYEVTIRGWVRALDLRDHETAGHTQRVTTLTVMLARQMGASDEQLGHIARGALLHDIGKLGISDTILHKPGMLSAEEMNLLKQHPLLGHELLLPIAFLQPALDIVYCHHERWDGSGYPRGLKGEEIPLSARMFAVVDVWDALVSDRPFRRSSSKEEAIAYIKDQAGKTLDPRIVEAFLAVIHD